MMKVCQNCQTENPAEEVFCSQCGMSLLARAAAGRDSEVQDAADRKAEQMRHIAMAFAWVCAASMIPWNGSCLVAFYFAAGDAWPPPTLPPLHAVVVSIFLVACIATAIACRWQAIGGVLLLLTGLLLFSSLVGSIAWLSDAPWSAESWAWSGLAGLLFAAPPLAAGCFFLASWRRSRRPEIGRASE